MFNATWNSLLKFRQSFWFMTFENVTLLIRRDYFSNFSNGCRFGFFRKDNKTVIHDRRSLSPGCTTHKRMGVNRTISQPERGIIKHNRISLLELFYYY